MMPHCATFFLDLELLVAAVSPDGAKQETLRNESLRYRSTPKPAHFIGEACSDECAVETPWIEGPGPAENTISSKWVATLPFFVKIGVEGHEAKMFRSLKRPVPFLSLEVNLREFRLEGLECVRLFRDLDVHGLLNYAAERRGLLAHAQPKPRLNHRRVLEVGCSE
jgi:hypothetical protein